MGKNLSGKPEPAVHHSGLGAGVSSLCGWLGEGEVWGLGWTACWDDGEHSKVMVWARCPM